MNLVVWDIKIEEENSLEILSYFRRMNKDLPIILNSAYSTYSEKLKKTMRELAHF
ncbi:MAG: hypothetical protein ACE5KJ_08070 [Candidatus Zixiibacteriota bacterium]